MDITDYDIKEVMPVAIKLYGHDANMENCKTMEELAENIGEDQVIKCVEEL